MVRRVIGHAPLRGIEQYLVADDPVAYEDGSPASPSRRAARRNA